MWAREQSHYERAGVNQYMLSGLAMDVCDQLCCLSSWGVVQQSTGSRQAKSGNDVCGAWFDPTCVRLPGWYKDN